jgi:MGT family glycosyltransferase
MSRVCTLGHPVPEHITPTLPLIAELVQRGDEVIYFATEPYRSAIEATGARFESYGESELFDRTLASGGMLGGMAGLLETTEQILPKLLDRLRAIAPEALLVEAHAVWGNLLAQVLRVPTVTLCSTFAINESLVTAAGLMRQLYGGAPPGYALQGLLGLSTYAETARRLQVRFGIACPDIIDYLGNRQALNVVFTSRELQAGGELFGQDYAFVGPSVFEKTAASEETAATAPADDDRPLIFVSKGTLHYGDTALYRACFEAFTRQPWRVVVAVDPRVDRGLLPTPPANVVLRDDDAQRTLLPQTALCITHGGLTNTHEAMWHGVPMLVLPRAADDHAVAARVAEMGAGLLLDRAQATPERLIGLAHDVLSDTGYRDRATQLGATLRSAGGHRRAADVIQTFTQSARTESTPSRP